MKNILSFGIGIFLDLLKIVPIIKLSVITVRAREEVREMATVFDVARYILKKKGTLSTVKLQKLVYYCQAWSLVWDERPLFREQIQAWANGPVVPKLFQHHKGKFTVAASDFTDADCSNLTSTQKETINSVLKHYGDRSAQWLVDLTHLEDPWRNARGNCACGESCNNVISYGAMMEYYSGLK
jgi:uncharacterized phage-associated protein